MGEQIKKLINDNKAFVIFYLLWFLFNLITLVTRVEEPLRGQYWSGYFEKVMGGYKITDRFWPFGSIEFAAYDKTEFIFYLILPFVLLGIWKLIDKDVKKYLTDLKNKRSNAESKRQITRINPDQFLPSKRIKKSRVISLLIISIIVWFILFSIVTITDMQGKSSLEIVRNGNGILLILRIATVLALTKKAKELKISNWSWGVFGFIFPIITLFIMLVKINKSNKLFKNLQLTKERDETPNT
jgi:hypothetical protein